MNTLMYLFPVCVCLYTVPGTYNHSTTGTLGERLPAKSFFRIGDQLLTMEKYAQEEKRSYILVSLHSNESPAIRTALSFAQDHGVVFYRLENGNKRNVEADLLDKKVSFDPNAIFTTQGRKLNLKNNHCWDKATNEQVYQFAQFLVRDINTAHTVVSVHSADNAITIRDYARGGRLQKSAKEITRNNDMDPGDYMLTTDENIFKTLKDRGFNLVLLNKAKARDDGSLSLFCARAAIPFVSVETRAEHMDQQLRMLAAIDGIVL